MTAGSRRASLAPYFPLPLVGAAVLLAVLILLTPNLLSTGGSPAAGSAESQAELLVDRSAAPGDVSTHLYLRGLGLARYAQLSLTCYPVNGSAPPSSLAGLPGGVRTNGSELLTLTATGPGTAFAVNASAVYVDAQGVVVTYVGGWAFSWSGNDLVTTSYGAVDGANPTPLDQLPLTLLLAEQPAAGGA